MDKRIKKLWIKALRSGKYKQGQGSLRPTTSTFCCLGVLCEIYRERVGGHWKRSDEELTFRPSKNEAEDFILPKKVLAWSGLKEGQADPKLGRGRKAESAGALNDAGKDFNYIANRIEKYL